MADEAQLVAALKNADAAGDTVAAAKLAAAIQAARSTTVSPPAPTPESEPSGLDNFLGATGHVAQGVTSGFSDEIVGKGRSVLENALSSLPANKPYDFGGGVKMDVPSEDDQYKMYRDENRALLEEDSKRHPVLSGALEVAGSFGSPISRIPGLGGGSAAARIFEAGARGAVEGGIYGAGKSNADTSEGVTDDAYSAAGTGALLSGSLTALGKALSNRNVQERLVDPITKRFKPASLADGGKGWVPALYRDVLSRIPGSSGAQMRQAEPWVAEAAAAHTIADKAAAKEAENLARLQHSDVRDLKLANRAEQAPLNAQKQAQELSDEANKIADARAKAASARAGAAGKAREEAAMGTHAEQVAATDKARHLAALKQSVPVEYAAGITRAGPEGFKQAKNAIDDAYTDAWGNVASMEEGTVAGTAKIARDMGEVVEESQSKLLNNIANDIDKLGEGDSFKLIDNRIRKAVDSATDPEFQQKLMDLRTTFRAGLPKENAVKLAAVDKVYPSFLVTKKAGSTAEYGQRVPSLQNMESASTIVSGQGKSASAEEHLRDVLDAFPDPAPPIPTTRGAVIPSVPSPAVAQKQVLGNALAEARQKAADDLSRLREVHGAQRKALAQRSAELKEPIIEAEKLVNRNAVHGHTSPWGQVATTGIGTGVLTALGVPAIPAALGIVGGSRALVTKTGQKFIAGQTGWQEAMADSLRKYDTSNRYIQPLINTIAGNQGE